jgi:H+-transporting ATPase
MRSLRKAARKVAVFHLPCGTLSTSRWPLGAQTTYTNRERRHLWSSRPSIWLLIASVADLLIASTLAVGGFAMTPLPAWVVAGALVAAAAFAIILDFVKVPVFRRLRIT